MPHIEINYSNNLTIEANQLFDTIEKTINKKDPAAGECKCRAYTAPFYKYTHIFIEISMLPKTHRDKIFTEELMHILEEQVKEFITKEAHFSLSIKYNLENYITSNSL